MSHAVIVCHPRPSSFTHAVSAAYREALAGRGGEVVLRDLYALAFDPVLKASEIPGSAGFAPAPDVLAERAVLAPCRSFTFIYPLWLNAMPAMLKGYLDRVFGVGFAFAPGPRGPVPQLAGKSLVLVTLSGAPTDWLERTGQFDAIEKLQGEYLTALSSLTLKAHVHCGYVVPGMTATAAEKHLAAVRAAAASV